MTKNEAFLFVRYLAVGAGTLTDAQDKGLSVGDKQIAIEILNHRLRELEGKRISGINPYVTYADQDQMIKSVREVLACIEAG